jgi:hypothetical protein
MVVLFAVSGLATSWSYSWVVCGGSVVLWWFCQVPTVQNQFVHFSM